MRQAKSQRKSVLRFLIFLTLTLFVLQLAMTSASYRHLIQEKAGNLSAFRKGAEIIKNYGLSEEKAHDFLLLLTSVVGRLTGSLEAERAVELMFELMSDLGLDKVWKEPVKVNRWVRGEPEVALVRSKVEYEYKLNVCALGNSLATPESGIEAGVVEVNSFEQLAELKAAVKGKIVFFNVPMDRTILEPFVAYSQAAQYRVRGASEAARYGAIATIIRSTTYRLDDFPHTGLMVYNDPYLRIPAAAISARDAGRLNHWLKQDPELKLFLKMHYQKLPPVYSLNLMGQLSGSEKPEEIILLGGHIDSWDLGRGAHDDAAGCAAAIEALRLIKKSGLKPKRTIRAVLFMDEEFDGTAGQVYAQAAVRHNEKHLIAIEQDRGGFLPLGLAIGGGERIIDKIETIEDILRLLSINWIRPGGGGVDITPLARQGTMPASVVPDSQKYFDFHHTVLDEPSTVHSRELELQAVILATLSYFLAQEGV
jgi:hypothetical protein